MPSHDESANLMQDIEARQDEALRQLDELERQVALVLAESLNLTARAAGAVAMVQSRPLIDPVPAA
jgi:hypothetical protein